MIHKHISPNLPLLFQSYETEQPFSTCIMCNKALANADRYAVEKVFKQNKKMGSAEIVYEYAICFACVDEVQDEISEESMKKISELYAGYSQQMIMRLDYLHSAERYDMASWIERCSFTGKEIRLCSEYSISGIIEGGKLIYEHSPLVVSDEFMELIQENISQKTRDYFEGFRNNYFDLPSNIRDIINTPTFGIF